MATGIVAKPKRTFNRVTLKEVSKILKLYKSGKSAISIGKKLSRRTKTITFWIKRSGIKVRFSHIPIRFTPRQKASAYLMYKAGKTATYIARKFNTCAGAIIRMLRLRGASMRTVKPMRRFSGRDWRSIRSFYANGMSARKIAETYGVPHSTIIRGLARKNVSIRRRPTLRLNLAKTTIAYAAGLFDGEGHITTLKSKLSDRVNFTYSVTIGITNTHKQTVDYIKSIFGGTVHCNVRSALSIKPVWVWIATSRNAYTILKSMYPYLRIKKERASVAIKLQERINAWPNNKRMNRRELAARERARVKIRALNGRGLFIPSPERKKLVYDYLKQFQADHPNAGQDHVVATRV